MSSKLFGAFRETLNVDEDQSLAEIVKDERVSDQPCVKNNERTQKPWQAKRAKKRNVSMPLRHIEVGHF